MNHQLATQSTHKEQLQKPTSSSMLQSNSAAQAPTHPLLRLQRTVGNQAVQRMIRSEQNDMQAQHTSVNAKDAKPGPAVPSAVHNVLKSSGQPLTSSTRAFMEPRFGEDFSQVRVHTDAQAADSARQVNALAYTVGSDVVFGADQYAPETSNGKKLLAHELTHVVQQHGNETDSPRKKNLHVGVPGDAFERQADAVAKRVTEGDSAAPHRISATPAPTLQRVSLDDVWEGAKSVASSVEGAVTTVGEEAWEGAKSVASSVEGAIVSAGRTVENTFTTAPQAAGNAAATVDPVQAAQIALLRRQFASLQARIGPVKGRALLAQKIHLSPESWATINSSLNQLPTLFAELPFSNATLASQSLTLDPETVEEGVIVLGPEIAAVLAALSGAIAALLEILGDIALILLIVGAILLLLYLIYQLLKAIVEAIEEAIERMRYQPPIFWSSLLPLPGPFGMTIVRTKPPNPRIPGGQQDTLRASVPPILRAGLQAHHILPLFLGGQDDLTAPPNVTFILTGFHQAGHVSLRIQPQMAIWGYSIDIYQHPLPLMYFLAGIKP